MEARGGYHQQLALYGHRTEGITVSVINPAQVTFPADVREIAALLAAHRPSARLPENPAVLHLRALVDRIQELKDTKQQEKNRLGSVLDSADSDPVGRRSLRTSIRWLTKQIKDLEEAMKRHLAAHPDLKRQVDLIDSIPGIALWSAAQVIAHGGAALTNRGGKALVVYAGLAPAHRQSGSSVRGKSHLHKAGDDDLRRILYMPAMGGATRKKNPNPVLQTRYQRLRDRGKPSKPALAACMQKLWLLIHAILKHQKPWDPTISFITTRVGCHGPSGPCFQGVLAVWARA